MADEIDATLLAAYLKLVEELMKVKAQRDRGDDDWEWSFLRVMWKYLEALQVPKELIAPAHAMLLAKASEIEQARRPLRGGRPLKPYGETLPMAAASAFVTALAKHIGTQKALETVSRGVGVKRKQLEEFRNNCIRARVSPQALKGYTDLLATIEREHWGVEGIASAIPVLRTQMVKTPPFSNT